MSEVLRLPVNTKCTVLYYATLCTLLHSYRAVRRHIQQDGGVRIVLIHNFLRLYSARFEEETNHFRDVRLSAGP
jgi:hypothetical protein